MPRRLDCQSILETAGLDFISRFLDSMGEQADQANRMEATLQLEVIARQAAKAQPSAALDEDTASPPSSPRPLSPWNDGASSHSTRASLLGDLFTTVR